MASCILNFNFRFGVLHIKQWTLPFELYIMIV